MRTRLFSLLALAVFALAAAPGSAQAQMKLTVGFPRNADLDAMFVAQEKGLFKKHGLDVTFTVIAIPPNVPPALMSGSIDIGSSSPTTLLQGNESGLDFVALIGASRETADNPRLAIIAKPNIKSAQDLVGKKVGLPGIGTTLDLFLKEWLKKKGVDPAKITRIELSMPLMGDVLAAGNVDAVTTVEPFLSRMIEKKTGHRLANFMVEVDPSTLSYFYVAKREWANAHRKEIAAFRAGVTEGLAYLKAHPDEVIPIQKKYIGIGTKELPTFSLSVEAKDFEIFNKLAAENKLLRKPFSKAELENLIFK